MASRTYKFGKESFTSKEKVRRWMGALRRRYRRGQAISDPAHLAAVADLLQGHVERTTKIGIGVQRYFIDNAPDHPSLCFWIERIDGSVTDFAVASCLEGIGVLNQQSLREIVRPVIDAFRNHRLGGAATFVSDYSGIIFPASQAHVDHTPPFKTLMKQFADEEGISLEANLLTVSSDASSRPRWRDPALPARFLRHHAQHSLRLVHWHENLSDLKRQNCVLNSDGGNARMNCNP